MDSESRSPEPAWRWLVISACGAALPFSILATGQRTVTWHGCAPISRVGSGKILRVHALDAKRQSAPDLRKFAIINVTTCGNAIDAFAETCLIPEPSTYE